jgi:hypothetical protein
LLSERHVIGKAHIIDIEHVSQQRHTGPHMAIYAAKKGCFAKRVQRLI